MNLNEPINKLFFHAGYLSLFTKTIPLGAIVAKRSLGQEILRKIEKQLRDSITFAFAHREIVQPFVAEHAQEMSPEVQEAHINLYVNEYSLSLGEKGREAVEQLLQVGRILGYYGRVSS